MKGLVRIWGVMLLAAGLCGCGPITVIELTVDGDLEVPAQLDRVVVLVLDNADGASLSERSFELDPETPLPVVILYEPDDSLPDELSTTVTGWRGLDLVDRVTVAYTWQSDRINEVRVVLGED